VSFPAITLRFASQRVFIVYFVIDSVRKHLDTPSYIRHFINDPPPPKTNRIGKVSSKLGNIHSKCILFDFACFTDHDVHLFVIKLSYVGFKSIFPPRNSS